MSKRGVLWVLCAGNLWFGVALSLSAGTVQHTIALLNLTLAGFMLIELGKGGR